MRRCYPDEALNAERLQDGWFKTRDIFYRDADGYFFHCGRRDEMFVSNGKNIYPAELERMLARHPSIEFVCAAPVRGRNGLNGPASTLPPAAGA